MKKTQNFNIFVGNDYEVYKDNDEKKEENMIEEK